jgi:nicotinamidase/pyrazinamidase
VSQTDDDVREALVIVDFQNDFTPGGALPVPSGHEIADRVRELLDAERFEVVIATRDWHPPDHGSFAEHGGPWPAHCVQGTEGAELHASLPRERVDVIVDKGTDAATEGYSAFDGTKLADVLRSYGVQRVHVVGLATDYCVRATALDALREGFAVQVDVAGVRGIEAQAGDVERALDEVRAAGGVVA